MMAFIHSDVHTLLTLSNGYVMMISRRSFGFMGMCVIYQMCGGGGSGAGKDQYFIKTPFPGEKVGLRKLKGGIWFLLFMRNF